MLSYRHQFHAGNHADVLKHLCLLALLNALNRKPAPWCYFDSHAGAGRYDINSSQALKTEEYRQAAGRIVKHYAQSELLLQYQRAIQKAAKHGHYPGSPWWAQSQLRPKDEMILCELHPSDARSLRQWAADSPQIHVHQRDGHEAVRALLPGSAKRGLVLSDPSFENKQEYQQCAETIRQTRKRFRASSVALWYPRLPKNPAVKLIASIDDLAEEYLHITLDAQEPLGDFGMYGSGMIIINPPWKLSDQIEPALKEVVELLGRPARFHIQTAGPR